MCTWTSIKPGATIYSGNSNMSEIPIYTHVVNLGSSTEIEYFMLYGYQDCEVFEFDVYKTLVGHKYTDTRWCNFGRHEGDWEHAGVTFDNASGAVTMVWTASHGNSTSHAPSSVTWVGSHPKLYVAFSTHGTYASSGTSLDDDLLDNIKIMVGSATLNLHGLGTDWGYKLLGVCLVIDKDGDTSCVETIKPANMCDSNGLVWDPTQYARNLVPLDGDPILGYDGRWGQYGMDDSTPQYTANDVLGIPDAYILAAGYEAVSLMQDLNVDASYIVGNGPKSPWASAGNFWYAGDSQ
jgi:hypothetical protein